MVISTASYTDSKSAFFLSLFQLNCNEIRNEKNINIYFNLTVKTFFFNNGFQIQIYMFNDMNIN